MSKKTKAMVAEKIEFCKDLLKSNDLTEIERARLEAKVDCLSWLLVMAA